jgi:hypothetical protein
VIIRLSNHRDSLLPPHPVSRLNNQLVNLLRSQVATLHHSQLISHPTDPHHNQIQNRRHNLPHTRRFNRLRSLHDNHLLNQALLPLVCLLANRRLVQLRYHLYSRPLNRFANRVVVHQANRLNNLHPNPHRSR